MNREDVIRQIQERYRLCGRSLNEFERRLWAATEAMKIGWGGISLVSKALRISPNTIKRGMQDLATGQAETYFQANARIRKSGGGRKSKSTSLNSARRTKIQSDSTGPDTRLPQSERRHTNRQSTPGTPTDLQPVDDDLDDAIEDCFDGSDA